MYQMQENSYGVGMPAAQVTDLVDGSGSDEWKLREAMNEVDKMHLQRLLDVKRVEKSLLDSQLADMQKLFSPARLPYSPQIAQSSSGRNCVNPDQALVKAGNPSQGFSLPLDSTTNVTSAKNTGANSLPYMSPEGIYYHQASPQYSGSDNSSLEKDHQIGAFLMSLGWGESGDVNLPNSGGAPKSSVEAPQYPSTCTLTTPAALRSLVGVLQNNTDELLITPSTLACLEVRANLYFSSLHMITKTKLRIRFRLIQPLSPTRMTATFCNQSLERMQWRSLYAINLTAHFSSAGQRVHLIHSTTPCRSFVGGGTLFLMFGTAQAFRAFQMCKGDQL